ncbi:biotin/lipoyl-binding protein [Stenotrophomonas sp. CD2]|nr:biotin/lipoyl-binding protein [Stenotrophomonas sp. CD2]
MQPGVSMSNRRTWIIAATVTTLAAGAGWWAFAGGDDAALITAPARVADLEKTVQAVGRVHPKELVAVGAQVSGQVKRLHVVLGQRVQAGDLIAEVDSQPQRIALRSAEAATNTLRAQHAASRPAMRRPAVLTSGSRSWWRRAWCHRKVSKPHAWRAMRHAQRWPRCRRRSTRP